MIFLLRGKRGKEVCDWEYEVCLRAKLAYYASKGSPNGTSTDLLFF